MVITTGIFNNYNSIFLYIFKALDSAILLLSLYIAHHLSKTYWDFFLFACIFLLVSIPYHRACSKLHLYESRRMKSVLFEIVSLSSIIIGSYALAFIVVLLGLWFFPSPNQNLLIQIAIWLAIACALHLISLVCLRSIFRNLLCFARSRGFNQRRILLIGDLQENSLVSNRIENFPEYGLQVVGQVLPTGVQYPESKAPLKVIGDIDNIDSLCEAYKVDQIWLNTPLEDTATVKKVMSLLQYRTISVRHALDFKYLHVGNTKLTNFRETPLLDIDVSPLDGYTSQIVKALQDKLIALMALLILSPVMIAIGIGVKLSSPGPIFYRQKRMTWNNKVFEMLKFRTMPVNSDQLASGWSSKDKGKSNAFTAFLRGFSLDELPQLINVLKGEMSLVGPRPERPEYVDQFKYEIPRYMKKHMVKAGITGWAQVNGLRGDTDLSERIAYDLEYIRNWSISFDMYIIWQTLFKGFVNQNAY